MYPLTRIQLLGFAAAGALVVLAVASIPACADELGRQLRAGQAPQAHSHDGWQ